MPKLSREGQMVFETILQMHEEGNEDLNKKDDGMRCAYRAGLRGATPLLDRRTREYAAWLAGREARRRRAGQGNAADARHKRKVRAIRMCDERWELLKSLGRAWLEGKLDEEMGLMRHGRKDSQEKKD